MKETNSANIDRYLEGSKRKVDHVLQDTNEVANFWMANNDLDWSDVGVIFPFAAVGYERQCVLIG